MFLDRPFAYVLTCACLTKPTTKHHAEMAILHTCNPLRTATPNLSALDSYYLINLQDTILQTKAEAHHAAHIRAL
jgi:hypothetical protein